MRVIIVSPHRDDAAFSCGLTMYSLLRAGADLTVLNVYTRSDYAIDQQTVDPHLPLADAVSRARQLEDEAFVADLARAAGRELSAVQLVDLGQLDAPLRLTIETEQVLEAPLTADQASAEARLMAASLGPLDKSDLVFAPMAIGDHIDHRIVRDATQLRVPPERLCMYEDLPYAARSEPPERKPAARCAVLSNIGLKYSHQTLHVESGPHLKKRFSLHYPSQIASGVADEMALYAAQWSGINSGAERWWATAEAGLLIADLLQSVSGRGNLVREQE